MKRWRWRSLLGGLLLAAAGGVHASTSFDTELDLLVRDGFERPAQSLAALGEWQRVRANTLSAQRAVLQAIGSVHAQSGAAVEAGAAAEQLLTLARDDPSGRSLAASNLVRAQLAETSGQLDVAAALAQSALAVFELGCEDNASAQRRAETCDYRSAWRALMILERRALGRGVYVSAEAHARHGLKLAEAAGDAWRSALGTSALALYAQWRDESDDAQRLIAQAKRLAVQSNDLAQQARVNNFEARVVDARGDRAAVLHALERAYALAARANAPRLKAQMLNNLSDAYSKLERYAEALHAAELAMPIVRQFQDLRAERVLINNAGIAKIGLGRIAEGKQDMARVLELWAVSYTHLTLPTIYSV